MDVFPYLKVHQVVVGNSSWPLKKRWLRSRIHPPQKMTTHTHELPQSEGKGSLLAVKVPKTQDVGKWTNGPWRNYWWSTSWLDSRILENWNFVKWVDHAVVTHVVKTPTSQKFGGSLASDRQAAQRTKLDKLERKQRRCASLAIFHPKSGWSTAILSIWIKGTLVV